MLSGFFLLLLLLSGCSGLERSEQEKIRKVNAKAEVILRQEDEKFCTIQPPQRRMRAPYSWEQERGMSSSSRE